MTSLRAPIQNNGRGLLSACFIFTLLVPVSGALHAQSSSCYNVAAGAGWVNNAFSAQTGLFSAIFDATPGSTGAQMDTVFALSNAPQTNSSDFTDSAVLVRFNSSGKVDARNGGSYPASSFAYAAGTAYRIRIDVNTPQHIYSVYVTPSGGVETPIALNYAFRTEQGSLSTLSNFNSISDLSGSTTVCNFAIVPGTARSGCFNVAAGAGWTNYSFTVQTGVFTAVFDATPGSSGTQMDTVMALSNATQTNSSDFTGSAVLVRFNSSGTIDARNGGSYPASSFAYSAGTPYRFRVVVNTPQHTYSVYVTPSGGAETQIASNYAFRSEQSSLSTLSNFNAISDLSGSSTVCNFGLMPASVYDQAALSDLPVALWDLNPRGATEPDLSGKQHPGTYESYQTSTVLPSAATMPNGDTAADFNGSNQYFTVPSNASFSIPTTHNLTWEGWIRPDVLQFPNESSDDYVSFMGKCDAPGSSPTCEWEGRMYSESTPQGRCDRISGYVFNPNGGEGSAADWQPACGLIQAGEWLHVVAEYTTLSQPSNCQNTSSYPGSINIWVNGVEWDQAAHQPTGCMSQYSVIPTANNSPLNIGTMAYDVWFKGAIGKVAIYNYLLSQGQINNHYSSMTGKQPTGSCGNTCSF